MFYQHLLYPKNVCIAINPLPLVYGLYTCENVYNCERPLSITLKTIISFSVKIIYKNMIWKIYL